MTSLGNYAFYNSRISSISIPGSISFIGESAFSNCTQLTTASLALGIISIGQYAFYNSNLNSITLPTTVASIGNYAFNSCINLTSVYFQGNAPTVGTEIFAQANNVHVYYNSTSSGWGSSFGGRIASVLRVDSDNDGYDDVSETEFGTNPLNSLSIPQTNSSLLQLTEFRFPTIPNSSYSVQSSTDLLNWTTVQSAVQGDGGIKTYQEYVGQNQRKFFRSIRN
jgi:hypothetical protein